MGTNFEYLHRCNSKKVLVSLLVGEELQLFWNSFCRESWVEYAQKFHFNLIIFNSPLDYSTRATSRSLSWQKCLVLTHPEVLRFDRAIWVDADILIHPDAPEIGTNVLSDNLAATDAWKFFTHELHDRLYDLYLKESQRLGKPVVPNNSPEEYYTNVGLPPAQRVWQAGVMVVKPITHAPIFQTVYQEYEEKRAGDYAFNFEMRPLSFHLNQYEIQELDPRFNVIFSNAFLFQNPELFYEWFRGGTLDKRCRITILRAAFFNAWFLHLAGGKRFLSLLDEITFKDICWRP